MSIRIMLGSEFAVKLDSSLGNHPSRPLGLPAYFKRDFRFLQSFCAGSLIEIFDQIRDIFLLFRDSIGLLGHPAGQTRQVVQDP